MLSWAWPPPALVTVPGRMAVMLAASGSRETSSPVGSEFASMSFSGVVSLALATAVLSYHGANPDLALQPTERYSMEGWYLISLWGAYLSGLIMFVVAVGRLLVGRIRSRIVWHSQATRT